MSRPMFPLLMAVDEVADALRMSRRQVGRLIEDGRLTAIRIDGRILVRGSSVENLVNHPRSSYRKAV